MPRIEQTAPSPRLVLVTGAPATGKTTFARALVVQLRWPLLEKDAIKESLFDVLGTNGRDRSRALGRASRTALLRLAARQFMAGLSCVVESDFPHDCAAPVQELILVSGARAVQVHCTCSRAARHERLERRALSGERHPGHDDRALFQEFISGNADAGRALDLAVPLVVIDTSAEPTGHAAISAGIDRVLEHLA